MKYFPIYELLSGDRQMDREHMSPRCNLHRWAKTDVLTKELSDHGLILQPLVDDKDNDETIQTN